jgi:hypothetical protein
VPVITLPPNMVIVSKGYVFSVPVYQLSVAVQRVYGLFLQKSAAELDHRYPQRLEM